MDDPLWTERYAPSVGELPQARLRETLARVREEPVNLILHGPGGAGKTAAVRALAAEVHEDVENDLTVINVADFFGRTKKQIRNDPRFAAFLTGRSRLSKRDMINYVLKESAAHAPVSGSFKTVLLDNAESIREDFQQALRRVMERYAQNTQFVITTRQPSKLIPPIESRCLSIPVRAPTAEEIADRLAWILEREPVASEPAGLEYIATAAEGDLRRAILSAQTTANQAEEITMETAFETLGDVGYEDTVREMLEAAEAGEFVTARKSLDTLLTGEGLDGPEVLRKLLATARESHEGDERALVALYERAGEIDLRLQEGVSARTQLARLLATMPER